MWLCLFSLVNYPCFAAQREDYFEWRWTPHAAQKQFSQVPYFEKTLPPPFFTAYSEMAVRAQLSQVLAISPIDMGCDRFLRCKSRFTLAFTERSSCSSLLIIKNFQNYVKHSSVGQLTEENDEKQIHKARFSYLTSSGNFSRTTGEQ